MKTLRSRYLVFKMDRGKSAWKFVLPPLVNTQSQDERLRICVRKLVYRSDFLVIKPGRDTLIIDGTPFAIKNGSPNSVQFCAQLTEQTPLWLKFEFDTYDGRAMITNIDSMNHTVDGGELAQVLGLPAPITLTPGQTYRCPFGVDLAPPEVLFLRMQGLTSSSLEVSEGEGTLAKDLLCVIGNDLVPYQSGVYRDPTGVYSQILSTSRLTELSLYMEDENSVPVVSNNPMTLILSVEIIVDDEKQILNHMKSLNELQQLSMLKGEISSA